MVTPVPVSAVEEEVLEGVVEEPPHEEEVVGNGESLE